MNLNRAKTNEGTTEEPGFVSGRFLSDFFQALEQNGVPVAQLLGDLPIPIGPGGRVTAPVEWNHFADFMARLERHVDGPEGLERCGELVCNLKPASMLKRLGGFSTSPYLLYRAASLWALRRAMPGIETRISQVESDRLEIHVRLAEGLRPCPQIFHFAVGGARALPRILDMGDAVVTLEIGECEALYRIAAPPSRTLLARLKRISRAVFSAGSVLQFLEAQQLELHAKHDALQKTNEALAESERRYRTITDTAVDVLCEIDCNGRVVYVSASVQDLIGYSPEQVTGSHFRLWIPSPYRDLASNRFAALASQPPGLSVAWERVALHSESGERIIAEISLRSYETPEGEWRMVGILRDTTDRIGQAAARPKSGRTAVARSEERSVTAALERLAALGPETPIARSLAMLLAKIESRLPGSDASDLTRFVEATRRMTQIVESAMVQTPESSVDFAWFETQKVIDLVRSGFLANPTSGDIGDIGELQIELSKAPSEIWGDVDLLTVGLGSLLDWVVQSAPRAESITLRADSVRAPAGHGANETAVIFSISASGVVSGRSETVRGVEDADIADIAEDASPGLDLAVDLAIAEDAAHALGGELVIPIDPTERAVGQIRLPQPAPQPTGAR